GGHHVPASSGDDMCRGSGRGSYRADAPAGSRCGRRPSHPLLAGFAADRHHVMEIWTPLLGSTVRYDFREDLGGTILDRPNDTQHHATRDPAPGARVPAAGATQERTLAAAPT